MTVHSKPTRMAGYVAGGGWLAIIGLTVTSHIADVRLLQPPEYQALLIAVGCLTVLFGVAQIMHGRLYQLGYLAGYADARQRYDDGGDDGNVVPFRPTGTR